MALTFLGSPAAFLRSLSPSANHLHALTNCTTFKNCLKANPNRLMAARIHGTVESILFARASSNAPALQGFAKRKDAEGVAGLPGTSELAVSPSLETCSREGDSMGEEKERR